MATIGNINVAITATTEGLKKGIDTAKKGLGGLGQKLGAIGNKKVKGGGILGAVGGALGTRSILRAADSYTEMNNKIRTVTNGIEDQKATMKSVLETANRARAPVTAVAAVFQRFAFAGKNFDTTNKEALKMVETLFKIGVVGGVTSTELIATLIQLSQGFGKGKLDGIELTSVMEQMAPLAQLLADTLGVPIGRLKDLGAAGKLTSAVIKRSLTSAAAGIDTKFNATTATVSQSLEVLENKWIALVGATNEASSATLGIAVVFGNLFETLDFLTTSIENSKQAMVDLRLTFKFFRLEYQTLIDLITDNPIGRVLGFLANLQAESVNLGVDSDRFLGPNNPLGEGKITEENSAAIVEELKINTQAILDNMSNFRQVGTI